MGQNRAGVSNKITRYFYTHMTKVIYEPEVCDCCSQKTTYLLGIDRGTVKIVKAIARFIQVKGINAVHPRKEMEGTYLTSNEVGNLSRPRFHGLIARVKGNAGNYLLTTKGAKFLKGEAMPKYAIISKAQGHNIGYFEPETLRVTVKDFDKEGEYWEGVNYDIVEGDVIVKK